MDGFGELMQLLENDIPECRRRLKESHANLEKVASYCEGNYLQVRQLYWHNLWSALLTNNLLLLYGKSSSSRDLYFSQCITLKYILHYFQIWNNR